MTGNQAEELPQPADDLDLSPVGAARNKAVTVCISCVRSFHSECEQDPCCCVGSSTEDKQPSAGRAYKDDVTTSAGRKRAAALWQIDPQADCEWRGLANCGGGLRPIVGCLNGKQKERQHGPDKDTTNNDPENMHLICAQCHHIWHVLNDPVYIRELYQTLPHEPREVNDFEATLLAKDIKRVDICRMQGWPNDSEYPANA